MRLWKGRTARAVERIDDAGEADERVLDHLARLGDPGAPCETVHYLYLPEQGGAAAVAEALHRDGWVVRVERSTGESWLVAAARVSSLTRETVRETRGLLESLAAEHGGLYDGWEARAD